MSARRGSLSLTRFFVNGAPPRDFRRSYLRAIRLRAFQPLKPDDEGVEAIGWCVMERPFDLELESDKVYEDRYLILGLRIDRYRIPAATLRAQLADEEQKLLARSGKGRLSRTERSELRAKLTLRLRGKYPPSTRALDVVWDVDGKTVLFFSHSRRVIDEFTALFEKTFGLELQEDSPYLAARRAGLPAKLEQRLRNVAPLRLVREKDAPGAGPEAAAESDGGAEPDALLERVETTRFLGSEFLLWIWLRGEFVSDGITLDDHEFHVWLDRQIVLESPLDKNERVTIRGAAPADGGEALEAVRARKFPVQARIALQSPEREYATTLLGPRFAIAGASLPVVLKTDPSEAFIDRMDLAERFFATLDQLYARFLRERLGDDWSVGFEAAVQAWLRGEAAPASALSRIQRDQPKRRSKRR